MDFDLVVVQSRDPALFDLLNCKPSVADSIK